MTGGLISELAIETIQIGSDLQREAAQCPLGCFFSGLFGRFLRWPRKTRQLTFRGLDWPLLVISWYISKYAPS